MNNILEHRKFVASQIEKSFGVENDIEKAYNVGDEKPYQGKTYYVAGFNAKGQPLWLLKKDGTKSPKDVKKETDKNVKKQQPSKTSAFVTKLVDDLKVVLHWRQLSDNAIEKLTEAVSLNEDKAKTIISSKFPAAEPVDKYTPYSTVEEEYELNDSEKLLYITQKSYNKTERYAGLRGTTKTTYSIYLKSDNGQKKNLGSSYSSKECKMEALLNYFK